MKETITRRYPDGTRAAYRLEPGSPHAAALLTPQKPWKIKRPKEKRLFPVYRPGIDSAADYVRSYFYLNTGNMPRAPHCYAGHLDHMTLYAPLPDAPAAVYTGVDSVETEPWADEPIPALYPDPTP